MLVLSSADFFPKLTFSEEFLQEYYLSVGHDLDPNCSQRLSADDKSRRLHEKS